MFVEFCDNRAFLRESNGSGVRHSRSRKASIRGSIELKMIILIGRLEKGGRRSIKILEFAANVNPRELESDIARKSLEVDGK